ncbi:hypothetical protein AB0B27_31145 [Micromonospora rifamycinica]|uniref:hypothetical protein n=1 Tax=Micromonospora rifamycinica TaxID=291594 RepID=UPI0033CAE9D1
MTDTTLHTVAPHELDSRLRTADERITDLHLAVTRAEGEAGRARTEADGANMSRQRMAAELSAVQLGSLQLVERLRRALAADMRSAPVAELVALRVQAVDPDRTDARLVAKHVLAELADLVDGTPPVLGVGADAEGLAHSVLTSRGLPVPPTVEAGGRLIVCRRCACTDLFACRGGCSWASDEQVTAVGLDPAAGPLCTACLIPGQHRPAPGRLARVHHWLRRRLTGR